MDTKISVIIPVYKKYSDKYNNFVVLKHRPDGGRILSNE